MFFLFERGNFKVDLSACTDMHKKSNKTFVLQSLSLDLISPLIS